MRLSSLLMLLVLICLSTGCASFRTTIVERLPNDTFIPNRPKPKTRGIPVKLKVPTHLVVEINETFFIENDGGQVHLSDESGAPIRPLSVSADLHYTDKVFTVDFKRPAGGMLSLTGTDGLTFDQEQYFKSIKATYEEDTLADINTALERFEASGASLGKNDTGLSHGERTVATARFDISEPGWEHRLHEFVGAHLTDCLPECRTYIPAKQP